MSEQKKDFRFLIDDIFNKIFQMGNVSKEDRDTVTKALDRKSVV